MGTIWSLNGTLSIGLCDKNLVSLGEKCMVYKKYTHEIKT